MRLGCDRDAARRAHLYKPAGVCVTQHRGLEKTITNRRSNSSTNTGVVAASCNNDLRTFNFQQRIPGVLMLLCRSSDIAQGLRKIASLAFGHPSTYNGSDSSRNASVTR